MSIRTLSMPVALLFGGLLISAPACSDDAAEGSSSADVTSSDDASSTSGGDTATQVEDGVVDPLADGGVGPGVPLSDQCTDDEILVVSSLNIESLMNDCTAECVLAGASDISGCVTACVGEGSDLGESCAGCFGNMAACVMANCLAFCPLDEEGCNACADELCGPGLQECVGVVERAGGESIGACLNSADASVAELGLNGILDHCPEPCAASGAPLGCMLECATDTGFSDTCSSCFGALGQCIGTGCVEACTAEMADHAVCMGCVVETCGESFYYCSGLELEANEPPPEIMGGCLGSVDEGLLDSPDDALATCMSVCGGDSDLATCVDECLASAGFTTECSGCLGELMECATDNCPDCAQGGGGDGDGLALCETCMVENCAAEEAACFEGASTGGDEMEGLCVNPEDADLLNAEEDFVDICMDACMMDADSGTCVGDCLQEHGVTLPCSGCMADLMGCIGESCTFSCSPESQSADGGADCDACVEQSCGGQIVTCFGDKSGEGDPLGPESLCGNTADDTLLSSEDNPHTACSLECLGADDQAACLTACLIEAGLSDECSDCLGDLKLCVNEFCGAECDSDAASDDDECLGCIQIACGEEHADCFDASGVLQPGGDPLCGGDEDASAIGANPDLFQSCTVVCADVDPNATCITNCLAEAGLSNTCSNCVAWMIGCMFESCPAECIGSDDEATCDECMAASCGDESFACFGNQEQGDPGSGGLPSELCINEQDSPILNAQPQPTATCGQQCFGAADQGQCVGDCLVTLGVTEDCSYCLGEMVACSMENCLTSCMEGDAPCQACMAVECQDKIDACYAP